MKAVNVYPGYSGLIFEPETLLYLLDLCLVIMLLVIINYRDLGPFQELFACYRQRVGSKF